MIESGSIPTHPTRVAFHSVKVAQLSRSERQQMVVEGWSPNPSDMRIVLSSILRATTKNRL